MRMLVQQSLPGDHSYSWLFQIAFAIHFLVLGHGVFEMLFPIGGNPTDWFVVL